MKYHTRIRVIFVVCAIFVVFIVVWATVASKEPKEATVVSTPYRPIPAYFVVKPEAPQSKPTDKYLTKQQIIDLNQKLKERDSGSLCDISIKDRSMGIGNYVESLQKTYGKYWEVKRISRIAVRFTKKNCGVIEKME